MNAEVLQQVVYATCLASNDNLSGPLSGPLNKLVGSFGGLIPTFITIGLVVLAIIGIFIALRRRDVSGVVYAMVAMVGVPFIAVLAALIFSTLWTTWNGAC